METVKNLERFAEFDNHKAVVKFSDSAAGLKGFIAIHNDNLGPATGGTRMFPYKSEDDALRDVLKLSKAMTYKCALAGVRHGGGKAVIIGDPEKDKNVDLLKSYARKINELNGDFTTGEDVGITEDDVQVMFEESNFFNGRRGVAGDPSPYAAMTTFYAMQVAALEVFGTEELFRKKIAIKGIGKVGSELFKMLNNAGANLIVTDIKQVILDAIKIKYPQVRISSPDSIHMEDANIFSPCALGNDVTVKNIEQIRAKIICGAANNQLETAEIGDTLFQRGISYVPDYVANAGGLINVVDEREQGGYSRKRVLQRIENMKNVLKTIYLISKQKREPASRVADNLAEDIFKNGRATKII